MDVGRTCKALLVAAVLPALAGRLGAQDAGQASQPPASGKVVVEEEQGDVHLAPLLVIDGMVRDTADGSALADARIELLATGRGFSTRSTGDGRFLLRAVPAGRYTVRITRLGYEPLVLDDVVLLGEKGEPALDVAMQRRTVALAEMVVTPGYFGLLQRAGVAANQSLSLKTLETVPQLGEDIYRAVARAPGVTTDDFSAKFGVRGGTGDELYVSLDGLELVEPFHMKDLGGAFSIVDIQTLGSATLNTGGFSAEYGDKLAGVFALTTTDPSTDGVHGSVAVSAMNARATLQGAFADGKGAWVVSARPGYLDFALKATTMRDSIQPRYYDVFAKVRYDVPGGGRVAMHLLRAGDTFKYLKSDQPNILSGYGSSYAWLTWDQPFFGDRLRMQSVVSGGAISWRRHGEYLTPEGVQTALIDDDRSLDRIGVRQDWTFNASRSVLFKWGIDAKRESAAYEYFRLLGTPQPDKPRTGFDSVSTLVAPRADKLALYFAPRVQLLRTVTVEAGARLDRSSLTDESIVSPRLNVVWQPLDRTVVRAAWGGYSQSQSLFSLQAEDGVSAFGRAERSEQRTIGVEQGLARGLTARVEAYDRRLTHARPKYANVGGDMWLFPELLWDRTLIDRTAGRDRGVEVQLARKDARYTDWAVSYALASSTDEIAGLMVPRSVDERHAVHGDWSLHPANGAWRLSLGGVWHTGWPYTPTILHVDTVSTSPTDLAIRTWRTPGALNSMRLRPYHRVDVRWTKYFHRESGTFSMFGEVYNLLGTVNTRGFWRDATVKDGQVVLTMGEIHQWPRLPVAGFSWQF